MNGFLNFRRFQMLNSMFGGLSVALLLFFSIGTATGQDAEIFKCPESSYVFTGTPEPTLCDKIPPDAFAIQIGAGTAYPKSSLIGASFGGNAYVVGDFEIDAPFLFTNAILNIDEGVKITVKGSPNNFDAGSSLGIDNSKLYCCDGMWKGIVLEHLSSISTYNDTEIEDAERAIYASGLCALSIEETTFNRNRIGVELITPSNSILAPGPLLYVFARNHFTCKSPLNGTTNEITEAGVKLKNVYLYAFQSGLNRFSDLKYGIYSEGAFSHIGANHLYMERIKKDGIYMEEGSIALTNSWFYTCEEKGINIGTAKLVNVKTVQFVMSNAPSSNSRNGIYIDKFALNADVQLNDINFFADMEGTMNKVVGIHLKGGNVGAGTKIQIKGNSVTGSSVFSFRAKESQGIYLDGVFPSNSTTEIWGNRFRVSNTTQDPTSGRPSGIETVSGDKNNLSIKWNTFTSFNVNTPPDITPPQWNYGIHLRDNTLGTNNEVSANGFNHEIQTLGDALFVFVFQNTKYCGNSFSGFGLASGVSFLGTCTGTEFTGNNFEFAGFQAFYVRQNTQITPQLNKGNEWHNLFGVEPIFHARCKSDPSVNKFIVHTQQSTCANESDPCFNPFHPRNIQSDLMGEFFDIDPDGTPDESCSAEFTGGGPDELDKRIAQGTFATPSDDPAMGWVLQRYLYHKFKSNPALVSDHASFPTFMTGKENTTVGKFYDVHAAIENALKAAPNVDAPSSQALSDMSGLIESLADVDEAIEQQGLTAGLKAQKENLILQIHNQHWAYNSLRTIHEAQVSLNLQTAYNLNQSITTTHAYETNERTVNQLHLLSLMQQGGELTDGQVNTLQAIAQQDPKQGGPAVHTALGMLKECAKPEIPEQYLGAPEPDYRGYEQMLEERNNVGAFREVSELTVSPNPTDGSFIVSNPDGNSGTLTLFDISGRTWMQQSFSGQQVRVDLKTGTPPGVYLLRFDMEDGTSYFKKLIVQFN
jgi:hypothetical protein